MKFQTKILLAYMIIIIIAISAITVFFYWYNAQQFRETAYANLQNTATRMVQQIDYQISYMDYTLENLISNTDFMEAIRVKGGLREQTSDDMLRVVSSNTVITNALYRDPLNKLFYRVNYFNRNFDFFTSRFNNRDTVSVGSDEIFTQMPWLSKVDEMQPKRYISPLHDDQWLKTGENRVFSILRNIRMFSVDAGYLEVQMEQSKLTEMLNINEAEQMGVVLVTPFNEVLFYHLPSGQDPSLYINHSESSFENRVIDKGQNVESTEIIVSCMCPYSGMKLLLIQNQDVLLAPFAKTGETTLLISLLVLSVAFILIYLWSVQLTKPIRVLRREMKRIELSDLTHHDANIAVPESAGKSKDDIKALNSAFYNLFNRLSISVKNEIRAHELQMQANFDSLQAQINPHFLYNVLNVISNRGLSVGDESIGEICSCIAEMLRYSTSTKTKTATVAEEIAHVENYLILLKKRYEHRLNYLIDVDERLMTLKIPKIVLQPFVENAVTHGHTSGKQTMYISIAGRIADDRWSIEIKDNGSGFDKETLYKLHNAIEHMDMKLLPGMDSVQLSLGGMGVVGTYARLRMFLKNIQFSIGNNPGSGAFVRIEGEFQKEHVNA